MLVGMDAGGTGVSVMVVDGDRAIAEHRFPTISPAAAGPEMALDQLVEILQWIATRTDGRATICIGSSSIFQVGQSGMRRQLLAAAGRSTLRATVAVVDDPALPLFASPLHGIGVGVICGTGSVVVGRDEKANTARRGGYDYVLSDTGSAAHIGGVALRAATRAFDTTGPPTALLDALVEHFGAGLPAVGARIASTPYPKAVIAGFAATVSDVADSGDEIAIGVITNCATELGDAVISVCRELPTLTRVSVCGSVPANSEVFGQAFRLRIGSEIDAEVTVSQGAVAHAIDIARAIDRTGLLPAGFEQFLGMIIELGPTTA